MQSLAHSAQPKHGEVYSAQRPALGARLFTAAQLVRPGRAVADIGCDHGKLAVFLALSGAPRVYAVDSRPLPLARAKALAQQAGCNRVLQCCLASGLSTLVPGQVDDIIIAGLSGQTIAEILQESPLPKNKALRLILLPTTQHPFLRAWLCRHGFALQREVPVIEKGRVYVAMQAAYTGSPFSPSPLFCQLGLVAGPAPCHSLLAPMAAAGQGAVPPAVLAQSNICLQNTAQKSKNLQNTMAGGTGTQGAAHTAGAAQMHPAAAAYIRARLAHLQKQALAAMPPRQRRQHQQLMQEVKACLQ